LAEQTPNHKSAFLLAAHFGRFRAMQYLLEEQGASMTENDDYGQTVSDILATVYKKASATKLPSLLKAKVMLDDAPPSIIAELSPQHAKLYRREARSAAEVSSLLKVMVMLEDAPADSTAKLSPQHAELCKRGQQLRAQLPSYLEQQRAVVVSHCPLPAVLRSLVTRVRRDHPGGHVGGWAARASAPSPKDSDEGR
jgi:hypothetical protein